jgi:hypothetical protein
VGARLVSQVLARWTHVSDRAFRILVRMALSALDEPQEGKPARVYFAGRDPLADVLRNERGGDRQTAYRTVKRAIAELIAEKAIERTDAGRSGHNAVYKLTLGKARSIDTPLVDNPESESSQGDTSGSVRGTPAVPPRNQEEPLEEQVEEIRRGVLPVDPVVVPTGGHAGPQTPSRPGDPSGHRIVSESSTSAEEQQPPQPETATHDRAREATAAEGPNLRLVEGNPDAKRSDERTSLFPAPVPSPAPTSTTRGFGFCLPCYAEGQTTLAADPVNGAACVAHLRTA